MDYKTIKRAYAILSPVYDVIFDKIFHPGRVAAINLLRRSRSDRWIAGVCGGIAVITGVDSWIWRLMFALLFLFGETLPVHLVPPAVAIIGLKLRAVLR